MKTKGFTLIELLVVIVIIGILATGATTIFSNSQAKARNSVATTDLQALASALNLYHADQGDVVIDTDASDTGANFANESTTGLPEIPLELDGQLQGSYIDKIPQPPADVDTTTTPDEGLYCYGIDTSDDQTFEFYYNLEGASGNAAEQSDGGDQTGLYEVGSEVALVSVVDSSLRTTPTTAGICWSNLINP